MTSTDQTVWTCDRCKTFATERPTSIPTRWRHVETSYPRSDSIEHRLDLCGQCAHQLGVFLSGHPITFDPPENT